MVFHPRMVFHAGIMATRTSLPVAWLDSTNCATQAKEGFSCGNCSFKAVMAM